MNQTRPRKKSYVIRDEEGRRRILHEKEYQEWKKQREKESRFKNDDPFDFEDDLEDDEDGPN